MISIVANADVYEVSFPYDSNLVALIKQVPGKSWSPELKKWSIPKNRLGFLLNQLKGTRYEHQVDIKSDEHLNENATLDTTNIIPNIEVKGYQFQVKEGATPYNHQLDFMKYAVYRQQTGRTSGFLLADEPGLSKTIESANLAMYNRKFKKFKHCLVICCINTSKYNWYEDIKVHTKGTELPYILGSRRKRDGSIRMGDSKEKLEDLQTMKMYGEKKGEKVPYFLITNVESIRYKVGRQYPIADQIIELINKDQIQMIIIDEIHKNASPTSHTGKQILKIKSKTGRKVLWMPMTGTPITNKPTDVFLSMRLVDAHSYSSFYTWSSQYCMYGGFGGREIMGYKNIPQLKNMLQSNMLRRKKSEVLDLPEKIYYIDYVENTPCQEKLYKQIAEEIKSEEGIILNQLNPLAKFMRLRQVNGAPEIVDKDIKIDNNYLSKNAKLVKLLEAVEDAIALDEKVIIFSNWVEPLRTIYRFLSKKYKVCCFTGTMKEEDRQKNKQAFQNNPEYKILLGTIGAAGTTHTFTAANQIIFYDEPWVPSDRLQAEDRAHRIGTTQPLTIRTLITRGSVDERVHNILYEKEMTSEYIVDGKLDLRKNPELFNKLLGKI